MLRPAVRCLVLVRVVVVVVLAGLLHGVDWVGWCGADVGRGAGTR